jgi:hypothetical protein
MKIYIGPYPRYKKGQPEKERKVRIRIDKYDTWNLNHTLSMIIHPLLVQLKATTHGAPYTDDEDVPEHLRSSAAEPKEENWHVDSLHFARWNWILDEMIWAFAQMNDENSDDEFYSGKSELLWQALDKDNNPIGEPLPLEDTSKDKNLRYQTVKGPNDTFKVDTEGLEKHHNRIKNGTRLFGKYFNNLWD